MECIRWQCCRASRTIWDWGRTMMIDIGTVRGNVPADITDTPGQYWMMAMYMLFMDNLLQDTRLLVAQNHCVAQNLTQRQRVNLTLDCPTARTCQVICVSYKMEGKWEIFNAAERPNPLDYTIQEISILSCILTCIQQSLYCWWCMYRLPQQCCHLMPWDTTVTTERFSGVAITHVRKDKTLDA